MPLYLRILLPMTLAASAYTLWSTSSEPMDDVNAPAAIRVKNRDSKVPPIIQNPLIAHDLFPDQGPSSQAGTVAGGIQHAVPVKVQPKPTAPPLPFQVMGVWSEEGAHKIILKDSRGSDELILLSESGDGDKNNPSSHPRVGDVLHHDYRLEKIETHRITFTYLPLQVKQTLAIEPAMRAIIDVK